MFTVYIDAILIGCVRIGYVRDTATTLFVYFRILLYYIYILLYIYIYIHMMYRFKAFYSNSAGPIVATRVLQNAESLVIIPLANWLTGLA